MSEQITKKIIYWSSLMEVCGHEDIVERIIGITRNDSVEALKNLKTAAEAAKAEDVTFFAHKLKGAASTMGALDLAKMAYSLESYDEDQVCRVVLERFEDLKNELEQVISFLSLPNWIEIAKARDAE